MAKWAFEPGHTAAEFSARHMMITHVRGHFRDVRGLYFSNLLTEACRIVVFGARNTSTAVWPFLKVRIPLTGLEPVVSALRGRRVNHLHYSGKDQTSSFSIHSLFHRRNGTRQRTARA